METVFHAQPYTIEATGFYFHTAEEFSAGAAACRTRFGEPVEEYEIQFIDGEAIDAELFQALGIGQSSIATFIDKLDHWDIDDKRILILSIGQCGYSFDLSKDDPSDFELDIYEGLTLRELAEEFVDEGLFGNIPERLTPYLDYDAIARDLGIDYAEATVAGQHVVYRCA